MAHGHGASFDLNAALKSYLDDPASVPCPEADELFNIDEAETLSTGQINPILDPIVEAVTINPSAIIRDDNLDNVQSLLK